MTDTQSPAAEQTSSAEPVEPLEPTDAAASSTSPTTDATSQPEQTDTISAESTQSTQSAAAAGPATGDLDDADDDAVDGDDDEAGMDGAAPSKRKTRVQQLEREGEVAADFLETLLDIADLDGDIDVDVDGDRAAVAIVDSEEGRVPRRLVGTDGKVLEALQELTRLAVQVETGERSRLMLDVAGHRAERRTALVELAHRSIAEVKETGEQRSLEPMSAFERKVVHDEVSAAGLVSESEGVEPRRHIVILPA
ncbi:spoIIIJ-associated protein [Terracoccus luteus]|uniref:SpoIIIJ-associated protein n=2 Tax=Terracoccus luteus TaxID=53356 RepID=A0A839Q3P9_9MICO|nr:spoIIIJ-associated protein [Terracoccus luteus]MCP2172912.1 spoIIIJ-associated protein [Terracoccus luteus]